jgi:predicted acylesterase/phospholipase RssA
MSVYIPSRRPLDRDKLGVALAGGGFRASLFHLGVLRRMAELDLLRYVEVLSTVSGGSIIGALYILLLKKRLDGQKVLHRDDYVSIVKELQETLVAGVRKNLRSRLFMNPLGILRVMLTPHGLGRRMARIYERYLFRKVVEGIEPGPGGGGWWRPGRIPLHQVRFNPGGEPVEGGIEAYNRRAVERKQDGSVVTSLILNATTLNSGAPFRFSSVEIGDPQLGFVRFDEIPQLLARKRLLQEVTEGEIESQLVVPLSEPIRINGSQYNRAAVTLALWWRRKRRALDPATPAGWEILFGVDGFPGRLAEAPLGQLRQAKLAAWYVRKGLQMDPPIDGGASEETHLERFWLLLKVMDEALHDRLRTASEGTPWLCDLLLDFVLELYYLRSAEAMSPRIRKDLEGLALSDAVGASACFPPVFPPMVFLGIYDDLYVTRLGLSDGGVYENLGVQTLLDEGCSYIVASDTGGLFDPQQRASTGRLGMMTRIMNILLNTVGELQRTGVRERRRVSRGIAKGTGAGQEWEEVANLYQLRGLAFFHIGSTPPAGIQGLRLGLDREAVARLRTDLDAFGEVEVAALVDLGYDCADRFLRRHLAGSRFVHDPGLWAAPQAPPLPLPKDEKRIAKILAVGQSRFFRSLYLWSPVSWIFTLAVFGGFVSATWRVPFSIRKAIHSVADWILAWLAEVVPVVGRTLVDATFGFGQVVLAGLLLGLALWLGWPRLVVWGRRNYPQIVRPVLSVVKWTRSVSANVFWLLGLAPLWIALGVSLVAWTSFLFFHLPFLSKTKVGPRGLDGEGHPVGAR